MTKAEIEEWLNREPFEAFRVNTSDGKHFDILNPRLVVAMETRVFMALPQDRSALISLRQVTSLEHLTAA
jgi:hypothetical protein